MPWDCLPEPIDEPHEWDGYDDDDHWYTKWRKKVKGWFAVGNAANRSKYKWANWREFPLTLLAIKWDGYFRLENTDGSLVDKRGHDWIWNTYFYSIKEYSPKITIGEYFYLSRVQYWCDWHIALQWPLFLHGHYGKWQAYIGLKRDADRVYWLSLYVGKTWK